MEDSHIADLNLGNDRYIFGVFDGHGGFYPLFSHSNNLLGSEVSEYVKRHFVAELKNNKSY
jgi:serine/threonine protein phosphatase PrpC